MNTQEYLNGKTKEFSNAALAITRPMEKVELAVTVFSLISVEEC
jgi:hypothetical protein